jgi:hypothetical protein
VCARETGEVAAKNDAYILKLALDEMTDQLNEFIQACTHSDGTAQTPTPKEIVKARSYLPARCSMTLIRKK